VVRLYSGLKMAVNPGSRKPLPSARLHISSHCPGVVAGGSRDPSPAGTAGTCWDESNSVRLRTIATSTSKSATKKIPDLSMRLLMSLYVRSKYVQFEARKE